MVALMLEERGMLIARVWFPGDSYTATILCTFNSVETCFERGESF